MDPRLARGFFVWGAVAHVMDYRELISMTHLCHSEPLDGAIAKLRARKLCRFVSENLSARNESVA